MLDTQELLEKYTAGNPELLRILTGHSQAVRDLALEIIDRKGLDRPGPDGHPAIDRQFVEEAAMLHDIGCVRVDAPSIHCYGPDPYICHGIDGRAILEAEGLSRHALVCERHTGSGISVDQIIAQDLPLPHRDMLPLTLEEKLICYADKFYSKSRDLRAAKPLDKIMAQMAAHGPEALARFQALHALFA